MPVYRSRFLNVPPVKVGQGVKSEWTGDRWKRVVEVYHLKVHAEIKWRIRLLDLGYALYWVNDSYWEVADEIPEHTTC